MELNCYFEEQCKGVLHMIYNTYEALTTAAGQPIDLIIRSLTDQTKETPTGQQITKYLLQLSLQRSNGPRSGPRSAWLAVLVRELSYHIN